MRTLLVAMIAGLLLVGCKPTDTGKPPAPAKNPTSTTETKTTESTTTTTPGTPAK